MTNFEDDLEEITVEMGSHHHVIIKKMFGPAVFVDIRIRVDLNNRDWVIERCTSHYDEDGNSLDDTWTQYSRIPALLEEDFRGNK